MRVAGSVLSALHKLARGWQVLGGTSGGRDAQVQHTHQGSGACAYLRQQCTAHFPSHPTSGVRSRPLLHRYAAMLGATTELQKAEGLAYDREGNRVFMAISAIEKGMEDFAKRGEANPAYDFGGLRGWGWGSGWGSSPWLLSCGGPGWAVSRAGAARGVAGLEVGQARELPLLQSTLWRLHCQSLQSGRCYTNALPRWAAAGGSNDMRLDWQPCGCVYQLDLDADLTPVNMKVRRWAQVPMRDKRKMAPLAPLEFELCRMRCGVGSWQPAHQATLPQHQSPQINPVLALDAQPLVCGVRVNETENYGNGCSLDSIANPDNIEWIDGKSAALPNPHMLSRGR